MIQIFKNISYIPEKFTGIAELEYDKSIRYYKYGFYHNESGPAIILRNGAKYWYVNNKLHNESGPSYEDSSVKSWWYNNLRYGYDNDFTIESWKEFVENKKREEELKVFL
jgi:hypothetical protein